LTGCAGSGGIERLAPGEDAYVYRGEAPSWLLSVDPRVIIFDNGSQRIVKTAVRPVTKEGQNVFRTPRLSISSRPGRCTLTENGALYSETVSVVADGRSYAGCGGKALASGSLSGSQWRLVAVNGVRLGANSASMLFRQADFTANLPCRTITGRYVESGIIVSFGQITASADRCPSTEVETGAAKVLEGLVTVAWSSADRLNLSSNAGSITLER